MTAAKPAPNQEPNPIRIMIADPDESFAQKLESEFKAMKSENSAFAGPVPVSAPKTRLCQSMLSDRENSYAAVFVNPSMGNPNWLAIVRLCHQYRSGVPVVVIYDEKPKVSEKEASQLGLAGFLNKKTLDYKKILECLNDGTEEAPPEQSEESTDEKADTSKEAVTDNDVVEVDLRSMAGRMKSIFDLYVRLSNGKYVKISRAGDILSADRIESYLAKGVKALFILKAAQADYLTFYDSMIAQMIKDDSVSIEVKTTQVSAQGASTIAFLKNSGFSEQSMQAAQQYVNNTSEVVQQISTKSPVVQSLLKDVESYEHSVAVTTLASLMIKHIGANTTAIYNAIGLACFLHDVALVGQPPEVIAEDESAMNEEQKKIFFAHPEEGAKLVKKMKGVPPAVITAVAQHHLRMNKQGFPKEKLVDDVNRMAELIGLCEEFLKLVKQSKTDSSINPFLVLKERASKEFSFPIVDAFIRTFNEK